MRRRSNSEEGTIGTELSGARLAGGVRFRQFGAGYIGLSE